VQIIAGILQHHAPKGRDKVFPIVVIVIQRFIGAYNLFGLIVVLDGAPPIR
jgi:hypothetical protein